MQSSDRDICNICQESKPEHKMWCQDCEKVHFICEDCYRLGKKEGIIVDYKGDIKKLDPDVAEELR